MPTHIALSDERAAQLRKFGEANGVGIADAVALLINHAIDAGLMDDELPGFHIRRRGAKVALAVDGLFSETLTLDAAHELAGQLDGDVDESRPHEIFNLDIGFITGRRGSSIKLKHPASGGEKTMAPSVARDLARLLRRAAA